MSDLVDCPTSPVPQHKGDHEGVGLWSGQHRWKIATGCPQTVTLPRESVQTLDRLEFTRVAIIG
jgi:hypothetical protein